MTPIYSYKDKNSLCMKESVTSPFLHVCTLSLPLFLCLVHSRSLSFFVFRLFHFYNCYPFGPISLFQCRIKIGVSFSFLYIITESIVIVDHSIITFKNTDNVFSGSTILFL